MGLLNKLGWDSAAVEILKSQKAAKAGTVKTGISFIDESIRGIAPGDLVVIGGRTGFGKTEVCTKIALNATAAGKQVAFFALESAPLEIEQRLLFSAIRDVYYSAAPHTRPHCPNMNFSDFYRGNIDFARKDMREIFRMGLEIVKSKTDGLKIFTPQNISARDLAFQLESADVSGSDLILVDHLHYLEHLDFDLSGKEIRKNEYEGVIDSVKLIRNLVTKLGKPLVLVSHVRKADLFSKTKFPTIDDLHGSSEISKRASAVVLIDRVSASEMSYFGLDTSPTVFYVPKFRYGGAPLGYYGAHNFSNGEFSKDYVLLNLGKQGFEVYKGKRPGWAASCVDVSTKEYQYG